MLLRQNGRRKAPDARLAGALRKAALLPRNYGVNPVEGVI